MSDFDVILAGVVCPFAGKAKIISARQWDETDSLHQNLGPIADDFTSFCSTMPVIPDGFLVTLPGRFGETISMLASSTNWLLRGLSNLDPMQEDCFGSPVESPEWSFRFGGMRHFVLTIAPCYGPNHARYGFGQESTFVLFQPDGSFDRHVAPGSDKIAHESRNKIRLAFAQADQVYDLTHTLSRCEAHRFVKPVGLHCAPVRWWEAPPLLS